MLTAGQVHDSTQLDAVLDGIHVARPGGRGRPRKRPGHLLADKTSLVNPLTQAASRRFR